MEWKKVRDQAVAALRSASPWWIPTVILLAVFVLHKPADRFEATQNVDMALDRQTGKLCRTIDPNHYTAVPLCSDLAKWWRW